MGFRFDINGLRAIAVMAVVLFHFGVTGMQGGFVGVDVFFVVSGFLMTGIICSRLDTGFTVSGFYLDRFWRIVPALAVFCAALLIVGWFLLLPSGYERLGKHTLGSLGFVSNLMYWKEAGYFDPASVDKWMLHTWSLSVEWQFYLIYPLLIVVLVRLFGQGRLRWFLLIVALGSYLLSGYASSRWPTSAFFLLPTRMWELLAGALVYLFPFRTPVRQSRALELSGIALIVVASVTFTEHIVWPGWLSAVPVFGTVLVIASSRQESLLTGNRISQALGRWSYSIYLWHWPLAVWLHYFALENESIWVIATILASIGLGWLSYRYVERRAGRLRNLGGRLKLYSGMGGAMTLLVALAAAPVVTHGFPARLSEEVRAATRDLVMPTRDIGWCYHSLEAFKHLEVGSQGLECWLGDEQGEAVGLIVGDSFAAHYGPFWDELGKHSSIRINLIATDWCHPSADNQFTGNLSSRSYQQCLINREYTLQNAARYDFVVLAGRWGPVYELGQMQGVHQLVEQLALQTNLVILMAAPTHFDISPTVMYTRSLMLEVNFDIARITKRQDVSAQVANDSLAEAAARHVNGVLLRRQDMFHVNGRPSDVTSENIPFSLDEAGHLSVYGSRKAASAFMETPAYLQLQQQIALMR
ncbi:MAG TPA: acyltransferase [Pseudomonas xinjiangensis]|uniref:Acyltransferase n=2 Tax=root TaxID=1 RepID=A0A7V1FT32_9GAMM|nr:acyltransferase [Halopseudomonas xinjiangensis]HEC46058.1 acyltransferase [Halopseudomonas xinjiangensis]